MTKVAVITRTKDRPVFLRRAMESVLGQTFGDWVHVIVNDGGDRDSVELLAKAFEKDYAGRLILVHHGLSLGMQNASNAGIEASDSEYLIIHDDDDSWERSFLAEAVRFLEEEGPASMVQGVVTQTTQVLEELTVSGEIIEFQRQPYYPFAFVGIEEMRRRNMFAPIAFLYRRKAHEALGLFRQEFDVLGDHDWNLRFLRRYEIGVIPKFLANYHWRHGSMGNTVTKGLDNHRVMLNRMKNVYYREWLDDPENAVGSLEKIDFPPPQYTIQIPFKKRREECRRITSFPELLDDYDFDVLSLDIFDTVLKRRCHRPKDIFQILEARLKGRFGEVFNHFAMARELAEKAARGPNGREVKIGEIYDLLGEWMGLSEEHKVSAEKEEIQTEKDYLFADPRWLDYFEQCQKAGKQVIFVSDMYLESATLVDILQSKGFASPEVYMSCECGINKHTGDLYGEVIRKLGVTAERVLHVGDNFHSDFVRAREAGLQAFHWSKDYVEQSWVESVDPYYYVGRDLLSSKIWGTQVEFGVCHSDNSSRTLHEKLGYEVAGPFYFCFLKWVLKQAEKDGVSNLVLMGRDGFYWKRTLDLLREKLSINLTYTYLHASRKVLNYASFTELNEDALEFLLTPNPSLRAIDFLDRAGLDSSRYLDHISSVGIKDPHEILTNETGGKYLNSATKNQLRSLFLMLRNELESLFANERKGMQILLKEANFDPKTTALVDIGWNASSVRSLTKILQMDSEDLVRGYFFGTWKEAEPKQGEAVVVRSYFMHLGKSDEHGLLLRESINWLESLNSAPYPTLLSLKVEGDSVTPVFSENLKTGFLTDEQDEIWKGAQGFLESFLYQDLDDSQETDGFNYLFLVLSRLLREPSPQEVEAWGGMYHSEGFGLEIYKRLIEKVSPDERGDSLLAAYRGSNWKRGFLAQLPDDQREYLVERSINLESRTFDQLKGDLEWKMKQADQFWSEKERFKAELKISEETRVAQRIEMDRMAKLHDEAQAYIRKLENKQNQDADELNSLRTKLSEEAVQMDKMRSELKYVDSKVKELETAKQLLEHELSEVRAERDRLYSELESCRSLLSSRWKTFKAVFKASDQKN